jgi:hypothetical protein
MGRRRFPPPWTVEDKDAYFIVRDHNGQALAYVYAGDKWTGPSHSPATRREGSPSTTPSCRSWCIFSVPACCIIVSPCEPCLPRSAKEQPSGPEWIHEIKQDGFRILAGREAAPVRLCTRNGYDFTARFPKIAATVESLPVRSCVLDGEAIVVDERGLSVFEPLRYRTHDHAAVLCALLELDGADFRSQPLEQRKATLAELLYNARDGIAFNRHFAGDGAIIFKHACALGCEGIVSKRLGSAYHGGRVNDRARPLCGARPPHRRGNEQIVSSVPFQHQLTPLSNHLCSVGEARKLPGASQSISSPLSFHVLVL